MRFVRNPKMTSEAAEASQANNRRRCGRLRCSDTHSTLGDVLDLSGSGMRVVRQGRSFVDVGDEFAVLISWDEASLPVQVKVARVTKIGFRKFEYGLQFMDLSDESRRELTRIAKFACNELVIARTDAFTRG